MTWRDKAKAQLRSDEGERFKLYRCTAGKLTIGVGHNIEDRGVSKQVSELMLEEDLSQAVQDAVYLFPGFNSRVDFTDNRKAALVNMAFQLGRDRLSGFARMRAAVAAGDWEAAADHALDSKWAKEDTPERAKRVAAALREG